jgi:hypothetical protein
MSINTKLSKTHFKGPIILGGVNLVVKTVDPTTTPTAHTASATLVVADYNTIHTNTSATASITLTLPAAATVGNKCLKIQLTAAQSVVLTPASGEKIFLGGSGTADSTATLAGVIGNYMDVYCDGSVHFINSYSGVITKS